MIWLLHRLWLIEAISLCEQSVALALLPYLCRGYAIRMRICLSCADVDAAGTSFQQVKQIGTLMNQLVYLDCIPALP